jgi:methylated-DNA-[protein]-cysteine S-methyltransferase
MEEAFVNTPLGIAKLEGDALGLSSISVLNTKERITQIIPEVLEDAVYQLNE